jgi:hypothetical protein
MRFESDASRLAVLILLVFCIGLLLMAYNDTEKTGFLVLASVLTGFFMGF